MTEPRKAPTEDEPPSRIWAFNRRIVEDQTLYVSARTLKEGELYTLLPRFFGLDLAEKPREKT